LLFLLPLFLPSQSSPDEFRLLQYLKENYDSWERPVANSSESLDVKVRLMLNQITDVDEKNQVMTILAYIDYHWTDYKLRWDPTQFGGIRDIRFSGAADASHKIWKPDILLFNSVSSSFDSTYSSQYIVNHEGLVRQNPPGIFRFACSIDITFFPFDDQTCFLKFGSWTYDGTKINLTMYLTEIYGVDNMFVSPIPERSPLNPESYYVNESIDLQVYVANGEWDLLGTPGRRLVTSFGDNVYHELYYHIRIRRRTLAYGINLIIPSLVISIMTVLGFTLPPDACEKVTLETTILLSVIFFLQMVSDMSPPQSKAVPILAAFFSCCLLVVSCSCVYTVLVLSMHHRKSETHEMGPLTRRIFLDFLPYILLMKRPSHPRAPKPKVIDRAVAPIKSLSNLMPMLALPRPSTTRIPIGRKDANVPELKKFSVLPESSSIFYLHKFCRDLELVSKELDTMTVHLQETYQQEILSSEWRFVAMAVDRLCLYLFTSFIAISTCGIILPHLIE
ncbi:hypothetical protein PENTCL1PPCAC_28895, partial [Pristionchus entomophagus]